LNRRIAPESAFSFQCFTDSHVAVAPPSAVPPYCVLVAQTPLGKQCCNRGCGYPESPDSSGRTCHFECPFGILNAVRIPRRITGEEVIIVAGKVFDSYGRYTRFVEKATSAGVDLEQTLEASIGVAFHPVSSLDAFLDSIVKYGLPVLEKRIDLPDDIAEDSSGNCEENPPETVEPPSSKSANGHMNRFFSNIMKTHNLQSAGEILVQQAKCLTRSRRVSLFLKNNGSDLALSNGCGLPAPVSVGRSCDSEDSITARVFRDAKPLIVGDINSNKTISATRNRHYASGIFVSLPLQTVSRSLGVLNLADPESGEPYPPSVIQDLDLLSRVASQVIDRQMLKETMARLEKTIGALSSGISPKQPTWSEYLRDALALAKRYNRPLSVAMVEVDMSAWTSLPEPDKVRPLTMRGVRQALESTIRDCDRLFQDDTMRLTLLLPETDRTRSLDALRRFQERIYEDFLFRIPTVDDAGNGPCIHVGLATFPQDGETVEDLEKEVRESLRLLLDNHTEIDDSIIGGLPEMATKPIPSQ